jgi:hypothetical protein
MIRDRSLFRDNPAREAPHSKLLRLEASELLLLCQSLTMSVRARPTLWIPPFGRVTFSRLGRPQITSLPRVSIGNWSLHREVMAPGMSDITNERDNYG